MRGFAFLGWAAMAWGLIACGDDAGTTTGGTGGEGTTSASTTTGSGGVGGEGDPTSGATTAGAGGAGASTTAGAGGAGGCAGGDPPLGGTAIADPADPCATLTAPGEPVPRIAFVENYADTMTFMNETSVLMAFQFATNVGAMPSSALAIDWEICSKKASQATASCTNGLLEPPKPDCQGPRFTPKFGIDPTQYDVGENTYTFTIRLLDGCEVVSIDQFVKKVVYQP
jgi:hypothetical protein